MLSGDGRLGDVDVTSFMRRSQELYEDMMEIGDEVESRATELHHQLFPEVQVKEEPSLGRG